MAAAAMLTMVLLGCGTASTAAALPGPSTLSTGFVDRPSFVDASDAAKNFWLGKAEQVQSSWVRIAAQWNRIAPGVRRHGFSATNPGDPQYDWRSLDSTVRIATARHQQVLMLAVYAPRWAEGPHRPRSISQGAWEPNAGALGQFARALAKRYSGSYPDPLHPGSVLPRVSAFQAWNEVNLPNYIMPQWGRTSGGAIVPLAPALYRGMLNAFYAGVKAIQHNATVLMGSTAPYGDRPGVARMAPVTFLSELLCLHGAGLRKERCPHPAHFDALDHHPYAASPTVRARNAGDVSVPDFHKLQRIVRVAVGSGRALPRGNKPYWSTEIAWSSSPPLKGAGALPLATQARYVSLAFFELWRQGISHIMWFLVRDNPTVKPPIFDGGGVFFANGSPKPSATAFRFPFVALPGSPKSKVTIWGRAPRPGPVAIQSLSGNRWTTVITLGTTSGGIFYAQTLLGRHLLLRAVAGPDASNAWSTG